jgi:hypothetical protein
MSMKIFCCLLVLGGMSGGAAFAETPASILDGYVSAAGGAKPSPQRGEQFFNRAHGGQWSCATCHGNPPTGQGAHASTGKTIAPLAPAVNPQRFTRAGTVEKWFKRNCNDVLKRECSATEKADVMSYLRQLKR